MKKFEFNISNNYLQAKELLLELRILTSSRKRYILISHRTVNEKIAENTIIQIVGEPGCYNGLLKSFISDSAGRIEYAPTKSETSGHVSMVTIKEC